MKGGMKKDIAQVKSCAKIISFTAKQKSPVKGKHNFLLNGKFTERTIPLLPAFLLAACRFPALKTYVLSAGTRFRVRKNELLNFRC